MKRKSLTMILCLLTCLSLVGVGFASWVITAGDTKSVNSNIEVDTVTDNRLVLTIEENKSSIWIGGISTGYTFPENAWLKVTEGTKQEALTVTYNCTVTKKSGEKFNLVENEITDLGLTAVFTAPTSTAYVAARDAGCFVEQAKDVTIENVKINEGLNIVTFTVSIVYTWGDVFNKTNPFDFYNQQKVNDSVKLNGEDATYGDHAAYYLNLLDAMDAPATGSSEATKLPYSLTVNALTSGTVTVGEILKN